MKEKSMAYNDFIKQINASGYQKAQGYDPDLFDKIEPDERDEIEEIIIESFIKGDRDCVMFLPKLKTVDGIALLKDELLKWPVPSIVNAEIAYVLWKSTGDTYYEDLLIEDIKIKSGSYRSVVIGYLLECTPSKKLENVFRNMCRTDADKLTRYKAAIGILYCEGLIKNSLKFDYTVQLRELINGLSSGINDEYIKAEEKLKELINRGGS